MKLCRSLLMLAIIVSLAGFRPVQAQAPAPLSPAEAYFPAQTAPVEVPVARLKADFTVDTTADDPDDNPGDGLCRTAAGKCSLRAAFDESNADWDADVIDLPDGVYPIASELVVEFTTSIQGASQAGTIIDGGGVTRALYVWHRGGQNAISNLTIRNCKNQYPDEVIPNSWGGAIYNAGDLELTNVSIIGNRAVYGAGIYTQYVREPIRTLRLKNVTLRQNVTWGTEVGLGGGGILNNGLALEADGLYVIDNTSLQGGGIYNNSSQVVTIKNFEIKDNTAFYGTGFDNDLGPNVSLLNGVISGNIAECCIPNSTNAASGGGIYNNDGHMRLTNVILRGNIAYNDPANTMHSYGGGIVNIKTMDLVNVALIGNQANFGAAIFNGNYTVDWPNQLNLVNTTISGNAGLVYPDGMSIGGAVFNVDNGKISMVNSHVTLNSSSYTGGIANWSANNTLVQLKNTIVALNRDDHQVGDCSGAIQSGGGNIIHKTAGNSAVNYGCTYQAAASDQVGIIPFINPLKVTAHTAYHPLRAGSQAIDRGVNDGCPQTDVKGLARPQGAVCDAGPDEYSPDTGAPAQDKLLYLSIVSK